MKGYVNSQVRVSDSGNSFGIGIGTNPNPSGFTFLANGWDSKGNVSSAKATGIHVYYDGAYIRNCDLSIAIQEPAAGHGPDFALQFKHHRAAAAGHDHRDEGLCRQ